MAKGVYIGVGGTAQKVKKMYVGVSGVARKVKKAYIGVDGAARLWWASDPLETSLSYNTKATELSVARHSSMSGKIKEKYALFCGGNIRTGLGDSSDAVDIYDESLTRTTSALGIAKRRGVGVSSPSKFFCLGGVTPSNSDNTTIANSYVFDENLVMTSIPVASSTHLFATQSSFGTRLGAGAFIAGGSGTDGMRTTAGTIDENLTITQFDALSVGRYEGGTANSDGKYALCGGGYGASTSAVVDCYDINGTRQTLTSLSVARNRLSAAQQEGCALFAGGYSSTFVYAVEVYDKDLVRTLGTSLAKARHLMASGSFDFGCVFAGGLQSTGSNGASSYCDYYDVDLVRSSISGLSSAKHGYGSGATIKDKFLVGGGANQLLNVTFQSEVQVFTYKEDY